MRAAPTREKGLSTTASGQSQRQNGMRRKSEPTSTPPLDTYATLDTPDVEPYIEVQKVDHASRVHLDIETDDIEAEVKRLEALGARRLEAVKTWVVMEAPTGQRFCVVRQQHKYFDETANRWGVEEK